MKYTLMNEDHQILNFETDETQNIGNVEALDGFDYAPIHFLGSKNDPTILRTRLMSLVSARTISNKREDVDKILAATGVKSTIELSLRSLGLSLADQYWYRPFGSSLTWKDVSCFDNEYDTSFGEAILLRDYAALAKANPYTPDCTLDGVSRKAWIRVDGAPMMLKSEEGTAKFIEQSELLSAALTEKLLDKGDYVRYTRCDFGGKGYIACRGMVESGEEYIPARHVLSFMRKHNVQTFMELTKDDDLLREFTVALEGLGVENVTQYYAKLASAFNLSLAGDCHTYNFGFIRDLKTMKLRAAPLFDRGRSFGSFGKPNEQGNTSAAEYALKSPASIFLLMLMHSSLMKPDWDYSWYDPKRLEGFVDDIEQMIGICQDIPRKYIEILKVAFRYQQDYLDKISGKSSE